MNNIEQTLSIIKPDAVERNLIDEIKNIFTKNKLKIKDSKKIHINKDEAAELGLPNSIGSFEELFTQMKTENDSGRMKKQFIGSALSMSDEEKDISFLNNYFVFKKIRNVNVQNVFEIEMAKTEHKDFEGASKSKDMIRDIMAQRIQRVFIRKFKKKFLLPTK